MNFPDDLVIRFATAADTAAVLGFIRDLAEYEKLSHEVVTDEATLRDADAESSVMLQGASTVRARAVI